MEDLAYMLEKTQCECLNMSDEHNFRNVLFEDLRDNPELYLQSDCDEELLVTLRFSQLVRVSALSIQGPPDRGPAEVKVFANALNLDFDNAKSLKNQGEFKLTPSDLVPEAKPIQLKYVNFQSVSSLSIFIASNQEEGDETVVYRIAPIGTPVPNEGGAWQKEQQNQQQAQKGDWFGRGNG